METITNTRVMSIRPLATPNEVKSSVPANATITQTVRTGRSELVDCVTGADDRMLVIVGPCSIHRRESAIEYAGRLHRLREELSDRLVILMRAYFEKPRTTVGWKGLISDPHLDESFDVNRGRVLARDILCEITKLGLPVGTEFLEPRTPQFIDDLVSWAAIGARTVESQTHREMASGLSIPVGFKNGTGGNIQIALDAMESARHPHAFIGIDGEGRECMVSAQGNPYGHLILRGGSSGPNYDALSVEQAHGWLVERGLPRRILVDCSHANSGKDYTRQSAVLEAVTAQYNADRQRILGVMLESHLKPGKQSFSDTPLDPNISITDACIGWEETATLLRRLYEAISK